MTMYDFPPQFTECAERILGNEAATLLASMQAPAPVAVRWNPYKTAQAPEGAAVPWNRYGRYLPQRPSFTLDPLFHAGAYYVQEASSMFVEHIVRSIPEDSRRRILDLCAAPGGKATLYSTLAGSEGVVVANETVRSRTSILTENIRKWGIGNTVVTNNDPSHFAGLREWFDIVAVDAPCSGEGMFRKNPESRTQWSPNNVVMCASRQRRIVSDAWDALRPGGVFIYSTCTFNRTENEDNVAWIRENFDCEDAGIAVPSQWNIEETVSDGVKCFRFWPHRIMGEGFFAAAVRKGGQKGRPVKPKARKPIFTEVTGSEARELARWVGQPALMRFARIGDNLYGYYGEAFAEIRSVAEHLTTIHSGICMGQLFGGKLRPDHALAMFHDVNPSDASVAELTLPEALSYLRKEEFPSEYIPSEGINLITYSGRPLGWAKKIGGRVNNLYPKSQMILYK